MESNYGISPLAKAIGTLANISQLKKKYDSLYENKVGYRPYKTPIKASSELQFMQINTLPADIEFHNLDNIMSDICRVFNVPISLFSTVDNSSINIPVRGISPLQKYLKPKNEDGK